MVSRTPPEDAPSGVLTSTDGIRLISLPSSLPRNGTCAWPTDRHHRALPLAEVPMSADRGRTPALLEES